MPALIGTPSIGSLVRFEGGPYSPHTIHLCHLVAELELKWKDTDEVAGVYRWDKIRRIYVWEQVSTRPVDPLPEQS